MSGIKVGENETIDSALKRFKRETFISVEQDVLIYRFESLDNEQVNCAISFDREKVGPKMP